MPLQNLRIESFRCLEDDQLALGPARNYLFGPNGAGKTSLLETIHMLGRGRSFRTRHAKQLARHGAQAFSVSGTVADSEGTKNRLSLQFSDGSLVPRLDGHRAKSMADLAQKLPVHIIEPNTHSLIEGPPSRRRGFLDWGVFHVEQGYLEAWRKYRRVLGQRNSALKKGEGQHMLDIWTATLVESAELVEKLRIRYVAQIESLLQPIGKQLLNEVVNLEYLSGWGGSSSFGGALEASWNKDCAMRTTSVGPHRADLVLRMNGRRVREEVSRGQQKLLAAALVLAQTEFFVATCGNAGILLVDDPAAELDEGSLGRLLRVLDALPAQQILTGLSEAMLPPDQGAPVFHVEQGKITKVVQ